MKALFNFLFCSLLIAGVPIFSHAMDCCPLISPKELAGGGDLALNTQQQQQVAADLIGSWENTLSGFELVTGDGATQQRQTIENANLKYVFYRNGTYALQLNGSGITVNRTGTWTLSEDAKVLVLTSDEQNKVQQIDIKHIVMDELVLGNAFANNPLGISAAPQDFYFNRF